MTFAINEILLPFYDPFCRKELNVSPANSQNRVFPSHYSHFFPPSLSLVEEKGKHNLYTHNCMAAADSVVVLF